jgi:hypothetical protein
MLQDALTYEEVLVKIKGIEESQTKKTNTLVTTIEMESLVPNKDITTSSQGFTKTKTLVVFTQETTPTS